MPILLSGGTNGLPGDVSLLFTSVAVLSLPRDANLPDGPLSEGPVSGAVALLLRGDLILVDTGVASRAREVTSLDFLPRRAPEELPSLG